MIEKVLFLLSLSETSVDFTQSCLAWCLVMNSLPVVTLVIFPNWVFLKKSFLWGLSISSYFKCCSFTYVLWFSLELSGPSALPLMSSIIASILLACLLAFVSYIFIWWLLFPLLFRLNFHCCIYFLCCNHFAINSTRQMFLMSATVINMYVTLFSCLFFFFSPFTPSVICVFSGVCVCKMGALGKCVSECTTACVEFREKPWVWVLAFDIVWDRLAFVVGPSCFN